MWERKRLSCTDTENAGYEEPMGCFLLSLSNSCKSCCCSALLIINRTKSLDDALSLFLEPPLAYSRQAVTERFGDFCRVVVRGLRRHF